MTLGEYIKQVRQSVGMTQQDLASKVGISYQQLSQYERGVRSPKPEMLEKISGELGYFFPEFMRLYYAALSGSNQESITIADKDTMPESLDSDLAALKKLMNANGFDLYRSSGDYYLAGKKGTYRLSEDQVQDLINGSVQHIDNLCSMLESVLSHIPDRQVTPWIPDNHN